MLNQHTLINLQQHQNSTLLVNNVQNQLQRQITPPKRPAVLCRRNSITPTQNTLLQCSNKQYLMNIPSPIPQKQVQQQWTNNHLDIHNPISQQSLTPKQSEVVDFNSFSTSVINQINFKIQKVGTNNFMPSYNTKGQEIRTSTLIQQQEIQPSISSFQQPLQIYNQQNSQVENNEQQFGTSATLPFSNLNIVTKQQELSFERNKGFISQNQNNSSLSNRNIDSNKQDMPQQQILQNQQQIIYLNQQQNQHQQQNQQQLYLQQQLPIQQQQQPLQQLQNEQIQQNQYNQQQHQYQQLHLVQIQQQNLPQLLQQNYSQNNINNESLIPQSMFQQVNFLPSSSQKQNNNKEVSSDNNFSSIKQEIDVPYQYLNQTPYLQQQIQDQITFQTSQQEMIPQNEEIERMKNELQIKNKEYIQFQEKYVQLVEDKNKQENEFKNILQTKEIMFQTQQQISQKDQVKINTFLLEIDRLTELINNFPKDQLNSDVSNDLKQKIEKLIEMNESLLIENKELAEENMQMSQVQEKNQQEIENLRKIIQNLSIQVEVLKKNEQIIIKRNKENQQQKVIEENFKLSSDEQKNLLFQLQKHEVENESMKYLLQEKYQEIEYWKNKSQNYQNGIGELEQPLQISLQNNQILNNNLMNFSEINKMENIQNHQYYQQTDTTNQIQNCDNEDDQLNSQQTDFDDNDAYDQFSQNAYKFLMINLNSSDCDNELNSQNTQNNAFIKDQYESESSKEHKRYPLQEYVNNTSNRQQDYLKNEIIDYKLKKQHSYNNQIK